MAKHVVIPALPDFVSKYPEISVELGVTVRPVDIVGEGVDFVIRVGELEDSGMVARRIGSMMTCTCAASEYLEPHGVPETIDDLTQHHAVHYIVKESGRPRGGGHVVNGKPCPR